MTHLPFIAASYGLTLALGIGFWIAAATRLSRARRRLSALEKTGGRNARGQRQ